METAQPHWQPVLRIDCPHGKKGFSLKWNKRFQLGLRACLSLSCYAPHWRACLQFPINLQAMERQLPGSSQPLLRVFHPANHPGGPPGNLLLPGQCILDAVSWVREDCLLLCSHGPECCWLPLHRGTLPAAVQIASHQGPISRAVPQVIYLEGFFLPFAGLGGSPC